MRHTSSARGTPSPGAPCNQRRPVVPRQLSSRAMSLIRAAVGVFASGAVTFGGLGVVTVGAAQTVTTPQRPPTCVSTGAVRGLSAIQAQNARIIVATAEQRAGRAGAYIAIMVALAESDLRILSNPNDPAGAPLDVWTRPSRPTSSWTRCSRSTGGSR